MFAKRIKRLVLELIARDPQVQFALGESARKWLNANVVSLLDFQRHADQLYSDIIENDDTLNALSVSVEACLDRIEALEKRVSMLETERTSPSVPRASSPPSE